MFSHDVSTKSLLKLKIDRSNISVPESGPDLKQRMASLARFPVIDAWLDVIGACAGSPDCAGKPRSATNVMNVRNRYFEECHWMSRRGSKSLKMALARRKVRGADINTAASYSGGAGHEQSATPDQA
jgi:hypothetical protein